MRSLFFSANNFNHDISQWDVSNVRVMEFMFAFNIGFDSNLSTWDVSRVTTMASMFRGARSFDQDLSSWNVASLTTMEQMFQDAISFNQNLCDWGPRLSSTTIPAVNAFENTRCPDTSSPNLSATPPGPFCHVC